MGRFRRPESAWEFITALDSVACLLAIGLAAKKFGVEDAMLLLYVGGTAPGIGAKHYAFASDCFPQASLDGILVVQGPVSDEAREETRHSLGDGMAQLEESCSRGAMSGPALCLVGCPVRFPIGGARGNRWLVRTPEPASWQARRSVTGNYRSVNFGSLAAVDKRQSPLDSLSQSAKQPSSGGAMAFHSSSLGFLLELPLLWSPRAMSEMNVGPPFSAPAVDEEYDQILQLPAVVARA